MPLSLLAAKLRIPEHPHGVVPRPRLTQLLDEAIPRHRLTVLSAPAGYGKTTLLAHWARTTRMPTAWLSLDEADDDLLRFLRYLLAAWERIQPEVMDGPLGVLLAAQDAKPQAVLTAYINAANDLAEHQAFVLDDYHLIHDPAIHDSLAFLLDHLPPHLHLVIGTRVEPPLPLARYRARGQLLELGDADLRFSLDEAGAFLAGLTGSELPKDQVERLQQQLEGWAAGLQLAALDLRQRGPDAAERPALSGRQRFIADYLSQDVVRSLPAEVRGFLLQTSLLERLSAPLCEAVTGAPGAQAMLERLERENLFVQALDAERAWFRYHPLFADFLRAELERQADPPAGELHRRAARWHLDHDLPEQAYVHAVAGQDAGLAVEIFDQYFNLKLNSGELNVVRRWVDALPPAWFDLYPVFNLMRVGLLAFTGEFGAAFGLVQQIETSLASLAAEEARPQMARVMAIRCLMACAANDLEQAQRFADVALRELPERDFGFRPGVFGALGDAYRRNGRWDEARACYHKALELTSAGVVRLFSPHVYGALADLELWQGRLKSAAAYWHKARAAVQDPEQWGRLPSPVIGWVYIRMGELLYERNQLSEAWDHLSRGLKHAEAGGDVRALIAGCVCAGRFKLSEGDGDAAHGYLRQAEPLVGQAEFPDWAARFDRLQLQAWLAQDQLKAALDWTQSALSSHPPGGRPEAEPVQLAMANVLIAKGSPASLEQAQALLEQLLESSQSEGRMGTTVEALALQALARWKRGDTAGALTALEQALSLAEPEGYVRLFVDLGLPMGRLLQEARGRGVMPEYVEQLLGAFGSDPGEPGGLPEPLTERETEVLQLMAAGLTNREIAEKLVVSPETVKKHSGNIYGKLGTGNRTQAVARARELGLLGD